MSKSKDLPFQGVKGRVLDPSPPRVLSGYEYVGAFTVGDGLAFSDPCHIGKMEPLLCTAVVSLPGTWHAYIRPDPERRDRTVGLTAAHSEHLDALSEYGTKLGVFGVDAGFGGFYDLGAARDPEYVAALNGHLSRGGDAEGVFLGQGAIAWTRQGDGAYSARGVRVKKRLVMIRLNLSDDKDFDHFASAAATKRLAAEEAEYRAVLDRLQKTPPGSFLPYQLEMTYTQYQALRHDSFGEGVVTQVLSPNKVVVRFAGGLRTLMHGRRPGADDA